ncbi:MAG: diguanylate cyclase [Nitrospirales bacterium]|nr:diguanylate cyclase [Nitrospirales bacterium]
MTLGTEKSLYKTFILSTCIAVLVVLGLIFYFMFDRTRSILYEDDLIEARSVFNALSVMRLWNIRYGGVYVEKRPGVETSPFVADAEITTPDGRIFTKRGHALMSRELSHYAGEEGLFTLRITSLRIINPRNKPDEFEEKALRRFEMGQKEISGYYTKNGKAYFRYMAPFYAEESCMPCHVRQGIRQGDVMGGMSINFPVTETEKRLRLNALFFISLAAVAVFLLLCLVWIFSRRLMKKTVAALEEMNRRSATDDLTGLFSRKHVLTRFAEEFERAKRFDRGLGCIIVSIMNFNDLNDRYGHLFGDEVIRRVAGRLKGIVRGGDILGRYGGAEFLIILPDTKREGASALAHRIKTEVRDEGTKDLPLSAAICFTLLGKEDRYIDDMLKRIDEIMRSQRCTDHDVCECV